MNGAHFNMTWVLLTSTVSCGKGAMVLPKVVCGMHINQRRYTALSDTVVEDSPGGESLPLT
eukprot:2055166-Amphidinium_carterae.1